MISGSLMGGLGNQLFQIFAIIAYSIQNKQRFAFPETINNGNPKRPSYWDNFLSPLNNFTTISFLQNKIVREKGFEYNDLESCLNDEHIYLDGYFQSYKYFEKYYDTICRLIGLKDQLNLAQLQYKENYANYISMHFRLGDYKHLQNYHPIMPYEYYVNSLQYIINTTKKDNWTILYFCEKEDNEIVKITINKLKIEFPNCKFKKNWDEVEDWKQMLIMSNCDHNIIANSSFSWWGAYFNQNVDKIVCYPSLWFGPALADKNTKDLCPDKWIKISVE